MRMMRYDFGIRNKDVLEKLVLFLNFKIMPLMLKKINAKQMPKLNHKFKAPNRVPSCKEIPYVTHLANMGKSFHVKCLMIVPVEGSM